MSLVELNCDEDTAAALAPDAVESPGIMNEATGFQHSLGLELCRGGMIKRPTRVLMESPRALRCVWSLTAARCKTEASH